MAEIAPRKSIERVGSIEIRWAHDGDPDDVVAPWPRKNFGKPVGLHVERMDDDLIWMRITDPSTDRAVVMHFYARKKGVLEWTAAEES